MKGREIDTSSEESGTPTSHRRRRLLAEHHTDFIGEDPRDDEDQSCLMAMGRADSEGTSSSAGSNSDTLETLQRMGKTREAMGKKSPQQQSRKG